MKQAIFLCAFFAATIPSQSQILKKIKDKVNKTIDKATGTETSSESSDSQSSSSEDKWCDTIKVDAVGGDGVSYSKIYSGSGRTNIVYNESSLSLGDKKGYRLILSEYTNGKTQFTVVENGKVVDTDTKVKKEYLPYGNSYTSDDNGDRKDPRDEKMKKYLVPDSTKTTVPKTGSKTVKIEKVEDDQVEMALEIARQTDDYKNMSAEEKKEFEETMRKGVAQHNTMAGQTITAPGTQGGTYGSISGYKLVVKGKNYGKFLTIPALEVSDDEINVFAVGLDDQGNQVMLSNGKKTMLDKNKFTAMGSVLRSPDNKKFVYIEQKVMTSDEMSAAYSSGTTIKIPYNVLKPDGTIKQINSYNAGKFILTNSGAVVNVNESTGEVYIDGKSAGKFALKEGYQLDGKSILIGSDPAKMAYYDGSTGSINYLDGSSRKLGVIFPRVVNENGKNYLSWFRKCKNDIYLAKFAY